MNPFTNTRFHPLEHDPREKLPTKFTFPFYYDPHPLCVSAAKQLQGYLTAQTDFNHNFGLNPNSKGLIIGKMFGVMVVKDGAGNLGYLAAFSGKLADSNDLSGFVPPLFDTLTKSGFYKQGETKLNALNHDIEALENADVLNEAEENLQRLKNKGEAEIKTFKKLIKTEKKKRDLQRNEALKTLTLEAYENFIESLRQQSVAYQLRLKRLKREWEAKISDAETHLKTIRQPIDNLKEKRANLSATLQKRLHEHYRFLNAKGEEKDLLDIFGTTVPPAGAGECAAPKLFQFAYQNNLKPIAMAEFWWGASPKSEVRKHKQFYPSCRSKCEPILGHMMQGLQVDDNPIEQNISYNKPLEIVFEDDYLLLVNKPHEFLSVPGKKQTESVLSKMKAYLPKAKGPLLVHRLDMSTSGLLLVAKTERIHKQLQKQFIDRSVKKRYVAILEGGLNETEGQVSLPLRVDLNNRPQQLVCYQHGKPATTIYKVISVENNKTCVHFYPVTGRTHQLRVHAAHAQGLKTPIVGDDLYGVKADRLYLHAEQLSFTHPVTKKTMVVTCNAPF
ncbi:MAG: pseudouridine synthase [Flavobacteriaceae bacterium]